jgi:hypothetical protein
VKITAKKAEEGLSRNKTKHQQNKTKQKVESINLGQKFGRQHESPRLGRNFEVSGKMLQKAVSR